MPIIRPQTGKKKLQDNISAARAIKLEELIDKYRLTKEKRIELFGERLLVIQEELSKRDLKDISTPKLFEMMIRCSRALEARISPSSFLSEEDIENRKKDREVDLIVKEKARGNRKISGGSYYNGKLI